MTVALLHNADLIAKLLKILDLFRADSQSAANFHHVPFSSATTGELIKLVVILDTLSIYNFIFMVSIFT